MTRRTASRTAVMDILARTGIPRDRIIEAHLTNVHSPGRVTVYLTADEVAGIVHAAGLNDCRQGAHLHGGGINTTGPDDQPVTIAWDDGA